MKAPRPWLPLFALLAACDNASSPGEGPTDSAVEASLLDAADAADTTDASPPATDIPATDTASPDVPAKDVTTDTPALDVSARDAQLADSLPTDTATDAPTDVPTARDATVMDVTTPIDVPDVPDAPVVPDAPAVPDAPDVPDARDAPAPDLAPVDVAPPQDVPTTPPPQLSQARSALGAVVARDGKVYAIGGATASVRYSNLVEMWDPVAGAASWVRRANLPIGIRSAGVALGGDGRIYVYGGENGSGPSARTFAYNPATDTWQELAQMARRRWGIAAAGATDGRVYAFNGNSGAGGTVRDAEAYDPMTMAWSPIGSTSIYGEGSGATGLLDGRVLLLGGYDNLSWSAAVYAYSPTMRAWSSETRIVGL